MDEMWMIEVLIDGDWGYLTLNGKGGTFVESDGCKFSQERHANRVALRSAHLFDALRVIKVN
jgi:hypothetical protein